MVALVIEALREFDAKDSASGKAYVLVRNLDKHVFSLRLEPFKLVPQLANVVEAQFSARKEMITSGLQCAAALLNPYIHDNEELWNDTEAMASAIAILRLLCPPDLKEVVIDEFYAFRESYPPFSDIRDSSKSNLLPYAWWNVYKAVDKYISSIAKRILAKPLSSSSCERNWSSYSFVHDKKRNQLLPKRANDLVFVYTNFKMISCSKLTGNGRFYGELEGKEDPKAMEAGDVD